MKAWLESIWESLRTSFWFVPAIMGFAAIGLAVGLILLDGWVGITPHGGWAWLHIGEREDLRGVLAAIMSAVITVLAVVFSITIATLTMAVGQLGPRLLRTFMGDRVNQIVLGTFVATFVYCLVVLHAVGKFGEGYILPHISTFAAFVLVLISVGMLVFFLHHVAIAIQAPQVAYSVARELNVILEDVFPEQPDGENHPAVDPPPATVDIISVKHSGYLETVDFGGLVEVAQRCDVVIWMEGRPGMFAIPERPLVRAAPAGRLDDKARKQILACFHWGPRRTAAQDVLFPLQELVEIAARALSTGINDPTTAVTCVHHLTAALCRIAGRPAPATVRRDEEGAVRLVTPPLVFADVCDAAFDPIRTYGRSHPLVTAALLDGLADIAACCTDDEPRAVLREHGRRVLGNAREWPDASDRARAEERFETLRSALGDV